MACFDENFFAAYFDLDLSPEETERLFVHVDTCDQCAQLFAATAAAQTAHSRVMADSVHSTALDVRGATVRERGDTPRSPGHGRRQPEVAPRLGRYVIDRILGMGGMGVVYAAHDPDLDRHVAIKLLRPDSRIAASALRSRLGREAQAMARLSHPNVINVHEIGTHGEQVFVVMELIDGTTLAEWLREEPRSWRQIVQVFVAAGAGLEAAHKADVVHRDFKPDNVLISRDGRVCVTDFGLARVDKGEEDSVPRPDSPVNVDDPTETYRGMLVGTPAYMAPEQMRGEDTDARTDIFSFCVSLYEALYGTRPYLGSKLDELRQAVEDGELQPPKHNVGPGEYRRAIVRGLSPRPDDRQSSMEELLSVLRIDPIARRRRRGLAMAAAAIGLVLVAGVIHLRNRTRVCAGAEAQLAGLWDAGRKDQIHRAFTKTGVPFAETVWSSVEKTVDRFTSDWVAMRTEACEATRLRGTQSEAMLDRRMRCLDDRLSELRAETEIFATADAGLVKKAAQAAVSLSGLERCADLAELANERDPPMAEQKAMVESVRARVAKMGVLGQFNRYSEMESLLPALIADTQRIGYWPAEADAHYARSRVAIQKDHFDEAVAALHDSVVAAERGHDDDAVARAWAQLVHLELARGHLPDALLWSRYADALCDRVRACDRWRPNLTAERAMLFSALGRRDDALKEAQRALVFAAKQPEGDHIALDARDKAATVLADAGRLDEAIAQERSVLADAERAFGPGHQSTLSSRNNLSAMLAMAHRFDEALPVARSAYELTSAAFGPEVSDTATSLVALGEIEEGLGQLENARQHLTHVAQIYEKNGIGGPNLVDALTHLGRVQQRLGDAGAGATLARAVSAGETAKVGPAELASTRMALAQALPATERKRAVEQATKARDAFAQAAKSGDAAAAKSRDEADAFLRAH